MTSACKVCLDCRVVSAPVILKKYGIETIYTVNVKSKRLSGKYDEFVINYSSALGVDLKENDLVNIDGELRSINVKTGDSKFMLRLYVLANNIKHLDSEPDNYTNIVEINGGKMNRKTDFRKSDKNEDTVIQNINIKVERFNKSFVIPCSCWNNNAKIIKNLPIGTRLNVRGRLQSHRTSSNYLMIEVPLNLISIYNEEKGDTEEE